MRSLAVLTDIASGNINKGQAGGLRTLGLIIKFSNFPSVPDLEQ